MKTPSSIIAFLLLFCFAASAEVTVTESARVLKNGEDIGAVPDAIKNGIVTPSEVQTALLKLIASLKSEREQAQAAASKSAAEHKAIVEAVSKDDKTAIALAVRTEKQRKKDEAKRKFDEAKKELEEAGK